MTEEKEWSQVEVAKQAKKGFLYYLVRTLFTFVLQICSSLLLAKWLDQSDFAIYGIINAWYGTALFFTDIGIGEILIQRSKGPSKEELASYIGIKLFFSISLAILLFIAIPFINQYYDLSYNFQNLMPFIGSLLILDTFMSIPYLKLQRELNFKKISQIDLVASSSGYMTQILSALLGAGMWCFFIGKLFRTSMTLILSHGAHPSWVLPKLRFSTFNGLFKKGMSYQYLPAIQNLKNIIIPALLNKYLSLDEIGVLFWLSGIVNMPMVFIINYTQVFFPSLAKLNNEKEKFKVVASKATSMIYLLCALIFGIGGISGPFLIDLFFGEKWSAGKGLIIFAAIGVFFHAIRTGLSILLASMGRSEDRFKIEIVIILVEIAIIVPLLQYFGAKGFFIAQIISYIIAFIWINIQVFHVTNLESRKRLFAILSAFSITFILHYYVMNYLNAFSSVPLTLISLLLIAILIDKTVLEDFVKIIKRKKI